LFLTPAFGGFHNFELKLRPHGRFRKEINHPFAIAGGFRILGPCANVSQRTDEVRQLLKRGAAPLVRSPADPIPRRVVLADPDLASGAACETASHFCGVPPNDLRVVPAHAVTAVGGVVVIAGL
jgi:hypothetical protein